MEGLAYAVVAVGILAFGLVSRRAERFNVTAPMVFVAFGFVVSQSGLVEVTDESESIRFLAEFALILILFTDASRIDLRQLWREHRIPVRLLALGLPLSIVAGAAVAMWIFGFNVWAAAALATVLAPTDAALGQAVVSDERVPVRIRQALNVESGLNDGIALPFLLLFLSGAEAVQGAGPDAAYWAGFAAKQVLLGPLVGLALGWAGARLLSAAHRAGWINLVFLKLSAIGLSLLSFGAAELVGGNGFIAAFMAGLAMGNAAREICPRLHEFGEAEGQLLSLLTFMVFGALMVPEMLGMLDGRIVLYALLSLTVVRMLPVALSLIGMQLRRETFVFVGWFGPRGIASILYALLVIERSGLPGQDVMLASIGLTVLLSVYLHGLTASPGAGSYAAAIAAAPHMPEHATVTEMPLRLSRRG